MVDVPLLLALLASWRPPEVHPWSATILALGVLLALSGLRRPDGPVPWRGTVAICALVTVSWLTGWDRSAVLSILGIVLLAGLVGWRTASAPSPGLERRLAAGTALLAGWGLYQVAWGFAALESQRTKIPEAMRDAVLYRAETRRAIAGLGLPGHLAILLVMALPIVLDRLRSGSHRPVWGALLLLDISGIVATRSLVGMGLALLVVACTTPPRLRRPILGVTLLASIAVVLSRRDLLSSAAPLLQRVDNWRAALWIWTVNPFLGAGPGAYRQAAQAVPFPVRSVSSYAHDLPLQALAELGPGGFLLCLLGLWWILRLVRRGWTSHRALAVAVAVVPIHNLVDFSLLVSGIAVPWAVLVGLLVARTRTTQPAPLLPRRTRSVLAGLVLAAVALAVLSDISRTLQERASAHEDARAASLAVHVAPWRVQPRLAFAAIVLENGGPRPLAEQARRDVESALHLTPRSAALWLAACRLDLSLGDPLGALVEARRAAACHPGWKPARRNLEELESMLGGDP